MLNLTTHVHETSQNNTKSVLYTTQQKLLNQNSEQMTTNDNQFPISISEIHKKVKHKHMDVQYVSISPHEYLCCFYQLTVHLYFYILNADCKRDWID